MSWDTSVRAGPRPGASSRARLGGALAIAGGLATAVLALLPWWRVTFSVGLGIGDITVRVRGIERWTGVAVLLAGVCAGILGVLVLALSPEAAPRRALGLAIYAAGGAIVPVTLYSAFAATSLLELSDLDTRVRIGFGLMGTVAASICIVVGAFLAVSAPPPQVNQAADAAFDQFSA